jgi:hypothetical protein
MPLQLSDDLKRRPPGSGPGGLPGNPRGNPLDSAAEKFPVLNPVER